MKKIKNILKNRLVIASLFFSISIFIMIVKDTEFSISGLVRSIIFAVFAGSVIFILNYPTKSK